MLTRRELLAAAISVAVTRPSFSFWQTPKSTLKITFSELPDLYCYLRCGSSNASKLGEAWQPGLAEMAKASAALTGRLAFAAIDGLIADVPSMAALEEVAPLMPEKAPGGQPLREPLLAVVQALKLAQPLYKKEIAGGHRKLYGERLAALKKEFVPNERAAIDILMSGLKLPDKGKEVPILLVAEAPAPAGFTVRSRKSGAVCYVGMREHAGTLLYETILHEATHALEVAAGPSSGSVLDQIRSKLSQKKVASDDALMRNVPHTLFFVHAGAVVRKTIDPQHKDYGEVTGLYKRMAATTDPVIKHWHDHLAGRCTADEAVDRIVADVVKGEKR